ncbi:acyl-CoA synthetase (NDP forming)/GNAT superfamily N-acetyltransferase [Actinoplanes lutulentus]|uniref:Acyl-CoA synthetase (NDP forming) n=1 Tax=Actinoplanes lutulentus TaxID=1287878 RepID=A0A327Z7C5_9ACTN|nr:bifunctional GNAT family N-acetyltransferase/acetate--CoA ligase family protein [Actinoplanes lutulentus]MBB2942347.1 acyl-CoA synthetase (NDP forming)/GNAT superfamily N-acetyltransferase [Actinoplanes lutulentus]RAK33117.1 acyl-CoA synthetase (NDP forming) [Actinoplanes lutulentus]
MENRAITRSADILLADGSTAHLRQIRAEDAPAIVDFHSRMSDRTRYLRYFSPYPRIPERDLQRFVNVDHHDREAFVTVDADGRITAVGRYERLGEDSPEAEVAFVVEDALQGRGIGSVLLEHLAEAARDNGMTRFVAEVLPENGGMLRVFGDSGFQVQRRYADGVVHLDFPIAPTEKSREVQESREHLTEARSIARLLAPRGIAIYGASASGQGIGAAMLGNLRDGGYTGAIVPVHPTAERVAGLKAYRSASEAGVPIDLALIAVPAHAVPDSGTDAARAGAGGVVVVSAGFGETGPEGAAQQRRLVEAARAAGLRVIGPSSFGIANTEAGVRLNATLSPRLPKAGRVGFFAQSGALGVALLAEADRRGLGLSSFVSAGNRADVSGNDLLQFWQDDPGTDVVLLYLETFGNPRKFARLARRMSRVKPVVAVASATRPPGLAGDAPGPDANAVTALFARSGVIRVDTVQELFDVGMLLAHQPLPAGRRVAVVGNSSALAELAVVACRAAGLTVADGYPSDVSPTATAHDLADALADAAVDPRVDALVVVFAPPVPGQHADEDADFAAAVASVALAGEKPTVATMVFGQVPRRVPAYASVEEAVRALTRVVNYADWLRRPPGVMPVLSGVDVEAAEAAADAGDTGALLTAYGIPVVPSTLAGSADAAVLAAGALGYPVALKAAGGGLRHRIDLGAVRLALGEADDVRTAYGELSAAFGPDVLVQTMVPAGVACRIEVVEDPAFGPVVGFGLGGVASELLGDLAWRAAPLTDRAAEALVDEPRAAPLLHGYRGSTPVDRAALIDLLLRVGRIADEHPRMRSLTLNPVLARPDGCSVLHAAAEFGDAGVRHDTGPRRLRNA